MWLNDRICILSSRGSDDLTEGHTDLTERDDGGSDERYLFAYFYIWMKDHPYILTLIGLSRDHMVGHELWTQLR